MIALYAYLMIVFYYFNAQLSTKEIFRSLTFEEREEQIFDGALNQVVMEMKPVTGYALASDFYQQQIGAAVNLFNFQRWAAKVSPKMKVVEPFVANSKLMMPHNLSPPSLQTALRFSDYFDIDYWNQKSEEDALVPWEQFITDKPTQMIIVVIAQKSTSRVVWEDEQITEDKDCYAKLTQFNDAYNYSIHNDLNATVVRRVCFTFGTHHNESLSMKEFNSYIFKQWAPDHVVVWFTCWSGIVRGRMSISDPQYQLSNTNRPYAMLRRSDRVNNDGRKYAMNNLQPNYTAISIRTVKLWMMMIKKHEANYVRNYLINCIKQLGEMLDHIRSTEHIYGKPFLAIDLGSYGDMSAKKFISKDTMKQFLEEAINVIYQNNTSIEEWEKSFLTSIDATTEKGYIAAVQAAMVENADCIVMVGGHSRFQHNILINYMQKNHTMPCIHKVCYME